MKSIKKGQRKTKVKNYLDPITSNIKRRRFAVFDIESKDDDTQTAGFTRPFLVGFYDPNIVAEREHGNYLEFSNEKHLQYRPWKERHTSPGGCIDKLLNVILTERYAGYIFYAHNGGNFDMLFLLAWLENHRDEYNFEVTPIQSTIQILRVWQLSENPDDPIKLHWEFLDSMRLIPMGLQKACDSFKIKSGGKVKFDLSTNENDERWSIYLKQDCVALCEVMIRLYDLVENRLHGSVGITAPSTAMNLFRRRFIGNHGVPEYIPRFAHWPECSNEDCLGCAHDWIRRGYYGGRTEIFRLRGTQLYYYDINSSYVAAMREDMPIGDRIIEKGILDWRKHRSPENPSAKFSGFCECLVYIPENCIIPPLPHRDRKTGKLVFPVGIFYGVWSVEELLLLDDPLVNGKVLWVNQTMWLKLQPMFGQMVQELWKLRDKKLPEFDEGLSLLAKLLGNSTYGKFAMKQERTSIVFIKRVSKEFCFLCGTKVENEGGSLCKGCEGSKPATPDLDSEVWYQAHKVDAQYIIPQVAAHITALARIRLWRFMKLAVELGGNIYYTDTDSIITDVLLPTSEELGDLKNEYPGEELNYMAIQPKVYMIEKVKSNKEILIRQELLNEAWKDDTFDPSALGDDIIKLQYKVTMKGFPPHIRTKENLEKLQNNETLYWRQLEKVRTLARSSFKKTPVMKQVQKMFRSGYDKRVLNDSDGSTSAILLDERKMIVKELLEIKSSEEVQFFAESCGFDLTQTILNDENELV